MPYNNSYQKILCTSAYIHIWACRCRFHQTDSTLSSYSPTGLTFLAASSLEVSYLDLASGDGINVYLLVKYDEENDVCANEAAVSNSSRRRRAADINFDQSILLEILDDPTM